MEQKTAPENGTAKTAGTITGTTGNPITTPAPATPAKDEKKTQPAKDEKKTEKPEKPAKPEELPPLEDRIYRVEQLFDLTEKYNAIKESLKKIESFKLSTDSNRDDLKLSDSKGNSFQTSNTAVIKEVIEVIKDTLKRKLKEVDAQIKF